MTTAARIAAAVAFAALAAGLLALYWWPEAKLLAGDEGHYQRTALAILDGGDWFDTNLIWPPLQGLFLAAIYAVFGPSILAAQLAQLLLLALSGLLLRRIWFVLTGDARAARWAGILLAVNPLTIAFATYLWPEILHLFLSLVLAACLMEARRRARGATFAFAFAAGAALGLCLLAKSLLTGFWPLLLLALIERGSWRRSLLRVLAFALGALLVTTPALTRGWQEAGRPIIADSSWFNLWVGLADVQRSDLVYDMTGARLAEYLASAEDHDGRVAFARERALGIVAEQGAGPTLASQLGKQYFRLFDARHFFAAQLHGPECRGYTARYRNVDPDLNRGIDYAAQAWHVLLLVAFALGLAAWRQWRAPWLWLIGAFVGYQLALFLGLHVKSRFLLPMLPVICAFAGHLLSLLPTFRATASPLTPVRRAAGLTLALLLIVLALGGRLLDNACA